MNSANETPIPPLLPRDPITPLTRARENLAHSNAQIKSSQLRASFGGLLLTGTVEECVLFLRTEFPELSSINISDQHIHQTHLGKEDTDAETCIMKIFQHSINGARFCHIKTLIEEEIISVNAEQTLQIFEVTIRKNSSLKTEEIYFGQKEWFLEKFPGNEYEFAQMMVRANKHQDISADLSALLPSSNRTDEEKEDFFMLVLDKHFAGRVGLKAVTITQEWLGNIDIQNTKKLLQLIKNYPTQSKGIWHILSRFSEKTRIALLLSCGNEMPDEAFGIFIDISSGLTLDEAWEIFTFLQPDTKKSAFILDCIKNLDGLGIKKTEQVFQKLIQILSAGNVDFLEKTLQNCTKEVLEILRETQQTELTQTLLAYTRATCGISITFIKSNTTLEKHKSARDMLIILHKYGFSITQKNSRGLSPLDLFMEELNHFGPDYKNTLFGESDLGQFLKAANTSPSLKIAQRTREILENRAAEALADGNDEAYKTALLRIEELAHMHNPIVCISDSHQKQNTLLLGD